MLLEPSQVEGVSIKAFTHFQFAATHHGKWDDDELLKRFGV